MIDAILILAFAYALAGVGQVLDYKDICQAEGKSPSLSSYLIVGLFWPFYLNK